MYKKKVKILVFIFISVLITLSLINIPYNLIFESGNIVVLTTKQYKKISANSNLIIKSVIYPKANNTQNEVEYADIDFKFFNLFTVKKLRVKISENNKYLAGGACVGISLKSRGVVVVGSNYVITNKGTEYPFKESNLKIGDVITHINDVGVNTVEDISNYLSTIKGNEAVSLKLNVLRKNEKINLYIKPSYDIQTKRNMLGLWIRDDALGIGTVSFVKNSNNRYGALGHSIIDTDTGISFDIIDGQIYNCNVVSVKKGQKGSAGELMGLFMQGEDNLIGSVDKNSDNGIFGYLTDKSLKDRLAEYEIGGRMTARPGKAKILSTINGKEIQEFEIEIIKTNYQTKPNEKSMVVKITDPELIQKTGGIVQGMSGSPIIQNGKIVGAITHVFVNDPTKGFGLYIDWMITE